MEKEETSREHEKESSGAQVEDMAEDEEGDGEETAREGEDGETTPKKGNKRGSKNPKADGDNRPKRRNLRSSTKKNDQEKQK